jgi:hypothetical protein
VLHFPYLAEPSLPDDELVIEMALFDLIFIHLLAYFISLLLQGCFYTHWLILRYTDEIVDDGLMHKAFNDVILFCQQTPCLFLWRSLYSLSYYYEPQTVSPSEPLSHDMELSCLCLT